MTEAAYRAAVIVLLSASVFLLAVIASSVSIVGADWVRFVAGGLVFVGLIGIAAGTFLFLAAAGAGRRLE